MKNHNLDKALSYTSNNNSNNMKNRKKVEDIKNAKSGRFLITINVFGSAGPLRFVVNGDDHVDNVIDMALKQYTREGRLPVLGSDTTSFVLYPSNAGFDALGSSKAIGSYGVRNFVLCKSQRKPNMTEPRFKMMDARKGGKWRVWLQKSLSLKILSH